MAKRFFKTKRFIWAIVLCVCLCTMIVFGFELSLRNVAKQVAQARAAVIVNNAVTDSAYRDDFITFYEKLISIQRDDMGEIQSVRVDGFALSQLAGQIQKYVEESVTTDSQRPITISLSSVLGTASIGISGPRFTVECNALPSVNVDIQSRFEQAGINQTKHSLIAVVHVYIRLFVAGRLSIYEDDTSVLLCETIIVGNVPNTYLTNNSDDPMLPLLPLTP